MCAVAAWTPQTAAFGLVLSVKFSFDIQFSFVSLYSCSLCFHFLALSTNLAICQKYHITILIRHFYNS